MSHSFNDGMLNERGLLRKVAGRLRLASASSVWPPGATDGAARAASTAETPGGRIRQLRLPGVVPGERTSTAAIPALFLATREVRGLKAQGCPFQHLKGHWCFLQLTICLVICLKWPSTKGTVAIAEREQVSRYSELGGGAPAEENLKDFG